MGALLAPLPAAAAPAPCEQAERYAAQSGAELMRVERLDLGPAGRTDKPITGIGLGDAKSALVAQSSVNSAALARVLNGGPGNRKDLTEMVQQTAPPSHREAKQRTVEATDVGPFSLGRGELTAHARWEAGMACGAAAGEATRARSALSRVGVLQDGDDALVRVPGGISSLSTTRIERRGPAARTVASASITGGGAEVFGGAVRIKVIKAPSLLAAMSTGDGGEVRYLPAVLEVSGDGIRTTRLDTAGDSVDVVLDDGDDSDDDGRAGSPGGKDRRGAGDDQGGAFGERSGANAGLLNGTSLGIPGVGDAGEEAAHREPGDAGGRGDPAGTAAPRTKPKKKAKAAKPGLLGGLPKLGSLTSLAPVPLPGTPSLPGLPVISEPPAESSPGGAPGTRVKVSLGDVRQASSGHAIAAKATAIRILITKGPDRTAYGTSKGGVILDLGMGLLEAAAVSPEPVGGGTPGTPGTVNGIGGGGLPITGPRVDVIALTGLALLIAGAGALVFGMRGRSRR
ncbi:hypothetical protein [Actinoplanes sp. NPDC026623]|uniref:hypothetical protein n=1 Tax=Actinoplanes sp. NPDC026623 TaxID=3155610 RepID=UPI0033DDAC8F